MSLSVKELEAEAEKLHAQAAALNKQGLFEGAGHSVLSAMQSHWSGITGWLLL